MFLKISFLIIFLLISTISCENYNQHNYFSNFACDNPQTVPSAVNCRVTGISSASQLQTIFSSLESSPFKYYSCSYNCYYDSYNKLQRKDLTEYKYLTFEDSQFEKFPSGMFTKLSKLEKVTAINVNLSEINRDDLKSFKSVKTLDLSQNNIKTLGNVVFLHLESLETLNLSYNQIESIHISAFDECSKYLMILDFSYNKLKKIYENLIDLIGQNYNSRLLLDDNEIVEIIPSESTGNFSRQYKTLSLSNNKLKSFNYNCSKIENLFLDANVLEEFSVGDCDVHFLDITHNSITEVEIRVLKILRASNNSNLSKINISVEHLTELKISNIPANVFTFEMLKNATSLENFDATNTFLGPVKIDTFSDLKSLKTLKLGNTGLSHIDYGMFSHQKNLKIFDISNNNLGSIDIKMLTSLKNLQDFDISGNNLTSLEHASDITKNIPNLIEIGIAYNNWNCTYLATLYKIFEENSILIKQPSNVVKSSSNVMGIGCLTSSQLKIKPLDADKANEDITNKMNEIIEEMNGLKVKNNNAKYDGDIIRAELFHIQKELLEMKSKMLKDQFVVNVTDSNDGKGTDIGAVKSMMDQLNNFTLEKQKLATDQLQLKIDQLQIQLTKKDIEMDKYVQKSSLKELLTENQNSNNNNNNVRYEYIKSTDGSETKTTHTLLIVIITSLTVIAVIFGYMKLKYLLYRRSDTMGVRARSTNTINTTVELPFNN